ncbi:hypothetical protein L1987_22904 [Smallanthus sonchifolius]|uniref:Uncharacterized protein n=1 Tax=Smallanthus sonchifolius TaxID=185202 RepID=A0ACB9IG55_9ASTR|nr:hypothetical protein L1987_22904 [Smallanthus sonchifolius]
MRSITPWHAHEPELLPPIPPVRLDRRTASGMRITHRFPGLGLRFVGAVQDQVWVPVPLPPMPGQGAPQMPDPPLGVPLPAPHQPHVEPIHDHPPQHPRHARRSVRLDRATQALLETLAADSRRLVAESRRQARQSDRIEDLMMWAVGSLVDLSRAAGIELPPLPLPRHYPDDPVQDDGGAGQDDGGAGQDDGGAGQA